MFSAVARILGATVDHDHLGLSERIWRLRSYKKPGSPFFIFDTMMIPRQQQLFIFSGNLARGQGMDGLTDADAAAAVLALRPSFMVGARGLPYMTST